MSSTIPASELCPHAIFPVIHEHKCWFIASNMEQDGKAHFWGNYSTQFTLWKLKHTSTLSSSMVSYSNIQKLLSHGIDLQTHSL